MPLTDNSLMPYGAHKGKKMANVPPAYLVWVFENNKCTPEVAKYINENMSELKFELKQKSNK